MTLSDLNTLAAALPVDVEAMEARINALVEEFILEALEKGTFDLNYTYTI